MSDYREELLKEQERQSQKGHKIQLIDGRLWQHVTCFVLGWLGLSGVANVIAVIAKVFIHVDSIPEEELADFITKFSAWINFSSYAIIFVGLLAILGRKLIIRIFGDVRIPKKIGFGLLYGLLSIGVSVAYNYITAFIFPDIGSNANQEGVNSFILTMPVIGFLMVVVLAPICEETTYRFGLFGLLYKKNKYLAYAVTCLLFGLIHTPFLSLEIFTLTKEDWVRELVNFPGYCLGGFVLCLAYERQESLLSSITAHTLNNLIAYVMTFVSQVLPQGQEGLFRIL